MTGILFAAPPEQWQDYRPRLREALDAADLTFDLGPDLAPEDIHYIIYAPSSDVTDFSVFTNLKAVLNLWAGVEDVIRNPTLKVPLARMVNHGLTEGMVEWVTGHVLRHHLGLDACLAEQDGRWVKRVPPLARDRSVGILGLGVLGSACARALASLNFQVTGWSRTQKHLEGVRCLSGPRGFAEVLGVSEFLVVLLPLTATTENILDESAFAQMRDGAVLLNAGRGALIDDVALLDALSQGTLAHATLDVFRREPLPAGHPFWGHPNVTVSPHVASETRPESAARAIVENIRRCEAGEPLLHLADPDAGY